jgi:hypothetical protein
MLRLLTFLALLAAAVFGFAHYLRRNGMFFPDRYPIGRWNPHEFAIVPSEHTFTTSDGVKLHGWMFRTTDADAPVLVWFHGNAGNLTNRADMAVEFARRGLSVFLFDYRGFGKSEGSRASESGVMKDSLAAFDYVKTLGARKVALYGESIGGPFAAYVASQRKGASAVVIENSFPSLKALGNALYGLGWTAPFALRTTDWLNSAGLPVLVLHGTRDAVVPYRLGKELYEGLKVRKEMLTSEAGHCEIPLLDPRRYYDAVTRFVLQETP